MLRLALTDGIPGLADAQLQLARFLQEAGCNDRLLFRAELVVEEVVMNVLHHGRSTCIALEAQLKDGRVRLSLEDDGPAFDPLQVVSAPLPATLEDAPIGGVGLRLVRKNTDALRYARLPTGRNRLELELE